MSKKKSSKDESSCFFLFVVGSRGRGHHHRLKKNSTFTTTKQQQQRTTFFMRTITVRFTTQSPPNNNNARASSSSPLRRWCPTHRCRRHTRHGTTNQTNQTNHHFHHQTPAPKNRRGRKSDAFSVDAVARPPNEQEERKGNNNNNNNNKRVIQKGDEIPDASLQYFDHEGNLQSIGTKTLCSKGKTIVVFAVPGAFLPTCTNKHLPGFIDLAAQMKQAGCDLIACVSVNDAFVMDAWGKAVGAAPVLMCGDGSGDFTRTLGCELDLMDKGLGVRSRRYAMIVKDGVVEYIEMERGGAFTRSRAEDVLRVLEKIQSSS